MLKQLWLTELFNKMLIIERLTGLMEEKSQIIFQF